MYAATLMAMIVLIALYLLPLPLLVFLGPPLA